MHDTNGAVHGPTWNFGELLSLRGAGDWQRAQHELRELEVLEDDWDGQGAKAPLPGVLATGQRLLEELHLRGISAPDAVVPGLDGEVSFNWHTHDQHYELEVLPSERIMAYRVTREPGATSWVVLAAPALVGTGR